VGHPDLAAEAHSPGALSRMTIPDVILRLPDWVAAFMADQPQTCPGIEQRMEMAVALARKNVERGTGGPFGAVVFERDTGRWIGLGVNLVTRLNCSLFHAEMVALALTQARLGTFDLAAHGRYQLVSSCEPCAMCLGAIGWAGVCSVVCGARDEDARAVGFDEGDKPAGWPAALKRRGIDIVQDVLRDRAVEVLGLYAARGGPIYNPRRP